MTARLPLVLNNGQIEQLQSGDTLEGVSGVGMLNWAPIGGATAFHVCGAIVGGFTNAQFTTGNDCIYIPFTVPRSCTVTTMGIGVPVQNASTDFILGIYASSSGMPSSLLASTAKTLVYGTSVMQAAVTSTTLTPGVLYYAAAWAALNTIEVASVAPSQLQNVLGCNVYSNIVVSSACYSQNLGGAVHTLPSSATPVTPGSTPQYLPAILING